jgi:hypothetical protein
MEALIYQLFILVISLGLLYFVVKMAVKNGVIQAHEKMNEQNAKKNSMTDNRYPLFGNDSNKSELQKKIENEAFELYAKKKLPIDYNAPIEHQREEVKKYVAEKMSNNNA